MLRNALALLGLGSSVGEASYFDFGNFNSSKLDVIPGITVINYKSWRQMELSDIKLTEVVKFAKFFLDPPECHSLPNGLNRIENSEMFYITCPESVKKVTLNFVSPADDPTSLAFMALNGSRKQSLTMKLNGFESVMDRGYQCKQHEKEGKVDTVCTDVKFIAHNTDASYPTISSITVNRTPVFPKPYHDDPHENYRISLYCRQPVWISARVHKPFKVDSVAPGDECGEVDSVTHFEYSPDKKEENNFFLYVTNADRSISRKVRVDVECIEGGMDLLSDTNVFPGYLEPQFRPHMYTYYYRVPWYTPAVSLTMKGVDSRKTLCSVNGSPAKKAGFSHTVALPDFKKVANYDIVVDCWAADQQDLRTRYIYQIIRNKDGETNAIQIDPIGCDLGTHFDPMNKGPYSCDMRLSDNETVPWVNFFVQPSDASAQCSVEDRAVDPKTRLSPHFRVPLGATERFRVRCWTSNNPVDETYVIDVRRPMLGLSVQDANKIGKSFAWLSSIFSSHRAHIFLHNNFMHRWISTTGRGSIGETYRGFASAFHPFNFFPFSRDFVKFKGHDWGDEVISQLSHLNLAEGPMDPGTDTYGTYMADRKDVLVNWEAEYQTGQNMLDYVANVFMSLVLIVTIAVIYFIVWLCYLKKSDRDLVTLRRNFPKWLHPARFWSFVLDFATISWLTSGISLLMSKRDYEVVIFNFHTKTKFVGYLSIGLLTIGPIAFFLYSLIVIIGINNQVLYSKSLNNYHDAKVQYARAMDRYLFGIPFLDAFFSWEVSKAMPICRQLEDSLGKDHSAIKKAFKDDDRTRDPLVFHEDDRPRPKCGAYNPRGAYTAACGAHENIDQRLLGDAKYKRFVGLGTDQHSAAKRYKGYGESAGGGIWNDLVRVDMDDAEFISNRQALHHLEVMPFHPFAVIGFKKFFARNPYDHYVEALCEVQAQHLTQMAQTLSPCRMTTYIPMDHLAFNQNMKHNNFIGPYGPGQYRGYFWKWLVERFVLAAFCVATILVNPADAATVTRTWALFSLLLAFVLIPSAMKTGHAKWYAAMEREAIKARRANKVDEEMENLYRVWPFRTEDVRGRFKIMRLRKKDHSLMGFYGSYRIFMKEPFQRIVRSQAIFSYMSRVFWCCLTGPVFQELMKASALLFIVGSNPLVDTLSSSNGAIGAITCLGLCMLSIGWSTLIDWYRLFRLFFRESYYFFTRCCWYLADLMRDKHNRGDRFSHVVTQISRAISGKKANWAYPGHCRQWIREFEIDEVHILNNEIGTHHPGRIYVPYRTERVRDAMDSQERRRFGLHKTLVKTGPVGYFRNTIDRNLPIQLPFSELYHGSAAQLSRLAATFQIVNHGGHRYPKRHSHWDDDDSFLSFYTDPKFVPNKGDLRDTHKGHGYSVKYVPEQNAIVIRGPGLKPGVNYDVRTSSEKPPVPDGYTDVDSTHSGASSDHSASSHSDKNVICVKHGRLVVPIPPGKAPNCEGDVKVYPPYGSDPFVIHGRQCRIDWDPHHRDMVIYSRNLQALSDPYKVEWEIKKKGKKFHVENIQCTMPNVLIVQLPEGHYPTLSDYIAVRDPEYHCIDIDPSDTDAHQFTIPDCSLAGFGKAFARMAYKPSDVKRTIKGITRQENVYTCPIPCTVVQCVNPLEREFRVEPNFAEGIKILASRKEEVYAHKQGLDTPEHLVMTALAVMSSSEFVEFWKSYGLDITERGRWINPYTEANHPIFRGKSSLVRHISAKLRQELDGRFAHWIGRLNSQISILNSWAKAYADPQLIALQLRKDEADWNMAEVADILDIIDDLANHKKQYESAIPNFQYPMQVYDRLIGKRPNMAAQYACWQVQVANWLHEEEAAYNQPFNGGMTCLKQTTYEFLHHLQRNMERPENILDHKFNTVLHYVTPSRSVRALDAVWRPDPLVAQGACVRVWRADDTEYGADFNSEPIWMTCLIKLTGNACCIYLPGPHDAARTFQDPYMWRHVYGFKIPLKCFQQVEINKRDGEPSGKPDQNVIGLRTEITWRKQLQVPVDDYYVKRIEDGAFTNTIQFPDHNGIPQKYRIMLGHTIQGKDAHKYSANEVTTYGDRTTVYPLTFRVNNLYYPRWRDVILGCQMYDNHRNLDGFNGIVQTRDISVSVSSTARPTIKSQSILTADISHTESDSTSLMTSIGESVSALIIRDGPDSVSEEPVVEPREVSRISSDKTPTFSSSSSIPPIGMYRGQWKNWRYHGKGALMDHKGDIVYDGEWRDGLRWGTGTCHFYDAYGCRWRYDGEFVQDEFCGYGTITLDDQEEYDRLKQSRKIEDKFRLVKFSGFFKLHNGLKRRASRTEIDHRTHKANMKKFFMLNKNNFDHPLSVMKDSLDIPSSRSSSIDTDSTRSDAARSMPPSDNDDVDKTLLINMKRWDHMGGAFDIGAQNMLEISKVYHQADIAIARKRVKNESDSESVQDIVDKSDAFHAMELMLPFRTKWIRELSPSFGFANIATRIQRGHAIFASGHQYEGHYRAGLPHGKGFFQSYDGVDYEGHFIGGVPHGYGIIENKTNAKKDLKEATTPKAGDDSWIPRRFQHCGEFYKGLRQGRGATVSLDDKGAIFMCGKFTNDKLAGGPAYHSLSQRLRPFKEGDYHQNYDTCQVREFVGKLDNNSLPSGNGKCSWWDDVFYRGPFHAGQRSSVTAGEDDKKGEPHLSDSRGALYDQRGRRVCFGKWLGDLPHGDVKNLLFRNDITYTGTMHKGSREGIGELYYPDGTLLYEGMFKNDFPDGRGTMYILGNDAAKSGKYEGTFVAGDIKGHGKFTWYERRRNVDESADRFGKRYYLGQWQDWEPHGTGEYNDYDGTGVDGTPRTYEWEKGEPKKGQLAQYKKKKLNVPPSIDRELVEKLLKSKDPEYWNRKRQLTADPWIQLHEIGNGMWRSVLLDEFDYVPLNKVPALKEPEQRPRKYIPSRLKSGLYNSNEFLARVEKHYKSFSSAVASAIDLRTNTTESKEIKQKLIINIKQVQNIKLKELGETEMNTVIVKDQMIKSKKQEGRPVTDKNEIANFGKASILFEDKFDPYFIVRCGRNPTWRTRPLADQKSGQQNLKAILMNFTKEFDYGREQYIYVELWDRSSVSEDVFCGSGAIDLTDHIKKKRAKTYYLELKCPIVGGQTIIGAEVKIHVELTGDDASQLASGSKDSNTRGRKR